MTISRTNGSAPRPRWTSSPTYHPPVFEIILPYLKETLRHPQPGSGRADLGAAADGCIEAVTPHLPKFIPYLISRLDDPGSSCPMEVRNIDDVVRKGSIRMPSVMTMSPRTFRTPLLIGNGFF